jgi:membrane protein implicated in regulation of membrane protease activity
LLRDSLRLLSAEAQSRLEELGPVLVLVGGAAATLMVGLAALAAGAIAGLMSVLPLWGAALVVAGLAIALAFYLGSLALRRLRTLARPPEHTLKALEEGAKWLRLQSNP